HAQLERVRHRLLWRAEGGRRRQPDQRALQGARGALPGRRRRRDRRPLSRVARLDRRRGPRRPHRRPRVRGHRRLRSGRGRAPRRPRRRSGQRVGEDRHDGPRRAPVHERHDRLPQGRDAHAREPHREPAAVLLRGPGRPRRRLAKRLGKPIIQGYGLTETSPVTHSNPVAAPILESIGPAIAGTEDRIVDLESGTKVLATGEVGEICVRGPQVMRGYWNKPQDTADVIRDGWFHTGDVGRKDERGYVFIVDRKKEFIKYKGFGVGPGEVEDVLCENPAIADGGVS